MVRYIVNLILQINGSPVVCDLESYCVTYNADSQSWDSMPSLPSDIYVDDAIAVQMDEQTAWITHYSDTTLIYTADGISYGPVLPVSTDGDQCLAKVDDDRYILFFDKTIYLYTWSTQTWSIGPKIPKTKWAPGCGVIRSEQNGLEFVVTGGWGLGEIMTWRGF